MLNLLREGTPWWVSLDMTGSDTNIVIPRAAKQGPYRADTGKHLNQDGRIILLGMCYDFVAAAKADGFTLSMRDNVSPATLLRTIWTARPEDAGTSQFRCALSVPFMFVPLPSGYYGSPGDSTSAGNAASLIYAKVGSGPSAGRLLLWGIHTEADWKPGKLFTGSPVDFNTAT